MKGQFVIKLKLLTAHYHSLDYVCVHCGTSAETNYRSAIKHPDTIFGVFKNTTIDCPLAGKLFKLPTVELEEIK